LLGCKKNVEVVFQTDSLSMNFQFLM
jgi:hypothetical protein